MKTQIMPFVLTARLAGLLLVAWVGLVPGQAMATGRWIGPFSAPNAVNLMLLLSDGTVMAANNIDLPFQIGNAWFQLVPDAFGHYGGGTWRNLQSMQSTRLFYSSAVLTNGSVFVAGGEYGTGWGSAEVYDPVQDNWAPVSVPAGLINFNNSVNPNTGANNAGFMDSGCVVLSDGTLLVSPVSPFLAGGTVIYSPAANTFLPGPQLTNQNTSTDEQTWVKLPDNSILTFDGGQNSQRYIPSSHQWIPDKPLPLQMYDPVLGETGPGLLLPDGRVFFLGGTGHTLLYTPSGNNSPGNWAQGPDIPLGWAAQDAPAATLFNGKILCTASPPGYQGSSGPVYPKQTAFFEYDYTDHSAGPNGTFTRVHAPNPVDPDLADYENVPSFQTVMLVLPDGGVLYSECSSSLYIFAPDGVPLSAGKPAISSVTRNPNGSFHLAGRGLNGISQGSNYGDDLQNDSNYPLVLLANLSDGTGHADYGRTYNWSSTGVMTGNATVTTEFKPSPGLIPDTYALTAIANGISSDPVTFYAPAWVDFNYNGTPQDGSFNHPFHTLAQGTNAVPSGGSVFIKTAGSSAETMTIRKPMTIVAVGGPATIGR